MRTQQRGPITDTFPDAGPDGWGMAVCECKHGKTWPEGDFYEPEGKACRECVVEWFNSAERRERFAT